MRALVQRVDWAEVMVAGQTVGQIDRGLLVYVGVATGDTEADAVRLAGKVAQLRIFEDEDGKLNRSCQDVRGGVLAVSNFTFLADTTNGGQPAFTSAAEPQLTQRLHDIFLAALMEQGAHVARGVFRAAMMIRSAAAGPVNVLVDVPEGTFQ